MRSCERISCQVKSRQRWPPTVGLVPCAPWNLLTRARLAALSVETCHKLCPTQTQRWQWETETDNEMAFWSACLVFPTYREKNVIFHKLIYSAVGWYAFASGNECYKWKWSPSSSNLISHGSSERKEGGSTTCVKGHSESAPVCENLKIWKLHQSHQ